MSDMVHRPPHYTADESGVECIDIIEVMTSPVLANAVKYLWRHDGKGKPVEDCEKAQWYVGRYFAQEITRRSSTAYTSVPFTQWRQATVPGLRAAAITIAVMLDSGKIPEHDHVEALLYELIDEIREGMTWSTEEEIHVKPLTGH